MTLQNATSQMPNLQAVSSQREMNAPHSISQTQQFSAHSPGGLLFDASVYGGLNYLVNGAISVGLAYYAMNKPASAIGKGFAKTGEFYEKLFMKFAKSEETAIEGAKFLNGNMWLGTGGFLMLLPIKWVEDRKQDLVTYADEKLGSLPKEGEARKAYDEALAEAPKQTNTSLWLGRIGSFAATCAAGSVLKDVTRPVRTRMTNFFKGDVAFMDAVAGNKSLMKKVLQDDSSMGRLVSDEIVLCAIGATLLYGASKAIASYNHYYKDGREAAKGRELERIEQNMRAEETPSAHNVNVSELVGKLEQPHERAAALV